MASQLTVVRHDDCLTQLVSVGRHQCETVNPVPLLPHAPGRWRSIGAEGCLSLRAVGAGYILLAPGKTFDRFQKELPRL